MLLSKSRDGDPERATHIAALCKRENPHEAPVVARGLPVMPGTIPYSGLQEDSKTGLVRMQQDCASNSTTVCQ
jgi:hypothetical protein